jgi:hypothetical protein
MSTLRFTFRVLSLLAFACSFSALAQAQATRTWVSGVGDDANPCSRTAPCKTFAGAISKTADGGEIDVLDPGSFGTVTITKGITIDGGSAFAGILSASTNGIIVNETTGTKVITLRRLSINGAGTGLNGIRLLRGKTFIIEHVYISGFTGNAIDAPLSGVASGGSMGFFSDVHISNLSGVGSIGIKLSAPASFFAVVMNRVHIDRIPTGIQVGNSSVATIRDSMVTLGTTGVEMLNGSNGVIENTMLVSHTTGLDAGAGSITRISEVSILLCSNSISNDGGDVFSSGNNRILSNSSDGLTPLVVNPR